MRSSNTLALFLVPFLGQAMPFDGAEPPLSRETHSTTSINELSNVMSSQRIFARAPTDTVKHWTSQAGGAKGSKSLISPDDPANKDMEFEINGKWYPLIQLDCTNSYKGSTWPGDYFDICKNYLWLRNCDPTMDDLVKRSGGVRGYPIIHRGRVNSNTLRRKLGGYQDGVNGPCDKKNRGQKTNIFYKDDGKNSLEEMHMALMEEGGLFVPEDQRIGQTNLRPGVGRSPAFRCVDSRENKSAGARIAAEIRKRGIQPKDSKSDKVPRGIHGKEYPRGAFILDVYNYEALAAAGWNYNWSGMRPKCINDGHQFLGLGLSNPDDMGKIIAEAQRKTFDAQSSHNMPTTNLPSRPKKGASRREIIISPDSLTNIGMSISKIFRRTAPGSLTKRSGKSPKDGQRNGGLGSNPPQTPHKGGGGKASPMPPPETPANQPIVAEEPSAPKKPKNQVEFSNALEPILFKGFPDQEHAWDKVSADDYDSYKALFPEPPGLELDALLSPLKKNWQYFPASKTGVGEGKIPGELSRFTVGEDSSSVGDTPSKPGRSKPEGSDSTSGKGKGKSTA